MTSKRAQSYPVSWKTHLHDLPRSGRRIAIQASEAERADIARFADLPAVNDFHAELELKPAPQGGVRVSGNLFAEVVQNCVVSLRPVKASLEVDIHRRYAPRGPRRQGRSGEDSGELVLAYNDEDPPEPLPPRDLDLAEILVAEFLLALDPYPHHPDAVLDPASTGNDTGAPAKGPFARLEVLKGGKKGRKS